MKSFIKIIMLLVSVCFVGVLQADEMAPAAQPAAQPAAVEKLKVDVKIGTEVQKLELIGEGTTFDASIGKVVGWTRVEGASEPTEITHVWLYKGNEISSIPLPVKSSMYRTYSKKTITGMEGAWTLQVKDSSGAVLATKDFVVTAAKAAAPAAPVATAAPAAPANQSAPEAPSAPSK